LDFIVGAFGTYAVLFKKEIFYAT